MKRKTEYDKNPHESENSIEESVLDLYKNLHEFYREVLFVQSVTLTENEIQKVREIAQVKNLSNDKEVIKEVILSFDETNLENRIVNPKEADTINHGPNLRHLVGVLNLNYLGLNDLVESSNCGSVRMEPGKPSEIVINEIEKSNLDYLVSIGKAHNYPDAVRIALEEYYKKEKIFLRY